ncbi:uncharacterized oxidoreductase YtbE [Paramormyrops kingsleyae]|uniref:Zgc:101765 n=1 Tax=Paramormyrops kingsleyae TaxID=1676925 RepID=A0A3B3QWJ9_9TELE|nr:uncharacterized protein LOC111834761 isoform X1 [Paramormyrops kingsleyae]XP_023650176.1 uncharacterized protein LOC111834761 isoform X1 [Paramormyrops kingsleyae]XP_023650186.1 uncharacterized protein LOC111834761 isoform X1 [Paramormyrops kingsleyae]
MSQPSISLNTGAQMPLLGLGTFRLRGSEEVHRAVDAALAAGYRAFDTATVYRNEADLGRALRELLPKYRLTRGDIFLTSKLGPRDQGPSAREACLQSLMQLGFEYIDLYLIHWPGTQGLAVGDGHNMKNRTQSWRVLEEFHASGHFRAIGVSNYTPKHLQGLLQACRVPPAVLQVEFHPKLAQKELRELCGNAGICFQAYSSLGTGTLVTEPVVLSVADGCRHSPAQVLLRWAVQQGVPVLPKSSRPEKLLENAQIFDFELSETEMRRLSDLDCGLKYCWDPSSVV